MVFSNLLHLLAQTDTNSSVEQIKLLEQQLEFLKTSHATLQDTFKYLLTLFITITGVSTTLSTATYIKTLNDARKIIKSQLQEAIDSSIQKQEIDSKVKNAVNHHLSTTIEDRISYLERAILIEERVRKAPVCYWVPTVDAPPPKEFELLKARGFTKLEGRSTEALGVISADVFIIDFNCWSPSEEDIEKALKQIEGQLTPNDSLILYYTGWSEAIKRFKKNPPTPNILPANSPASLMGNVVDAAYLAHIHFENQRRY